MADAVEAGGRVIVIDPMTWSSEVLRNGVARHLSIGFPWLLRNLETVFGWASYESAFWRNVGVAAKRVVLHRRRSTDAALIASPDEELASFDLAFIDGDHGYEGVKHDLESWGSRVRAGGIILVHDATPRFPGVLRALGEWARAQGVEVEWPTSGSLGVVHVGARPATARSPRATRASMPAVAP